ncbi:MAG: hypothetical protein ACLU98_06825 [Desulfovibrio fairfieldensis]
MQLFERVRLVSTEMARSQSDLAKKLGLTQPTFNGYLNEKRQDNLWPLLPRILDLYPDLRRDWLYFGEGEMTRPDGAEAPSAREAELLSKVSDLEHRLAETEAELKSAYRANQTLATRLLIDGVTDKDAATDTGATGTGGK